ncbi:hypothetical protein ID866_7541 [Astraeus odoratus]|nr:hypothetical protein ID866_7541 [Astraeus odoratus]
MRGADIQQICPGHMVAYNVIFAGETGHGKSSLINFLVKQHVSKTSGDMLGVTSETQRYIFLQENSVYRLWDTPGFNEGSRGTISTQDAGKALESLFKELYSRDGVHLLVFCFRFTKAITNGLQGVYDSILSCIHDKSVPVVAVVTHADEMRHEPNAWWKRIIGECVERRMKFVDYASVCTIQGPTTQMADERRKDVDDMWKLMKRHARQLSPARVEDGKVINIILFGEAGVGKSSVVNLIAGNNVIKPNGNAMTSTLSSTEHRFPVGSHSFRIWDTVGFDQPDIGSQGFIPAIGKAYKLIHEVTEAGGINLLLFCLRGSRVTMTVQSNYRLFYEVLCDKKVPIGLVITYLEHEDDMEDFWRRNENTLTQFGIKSVGHACVTGLPHLHKQYQLSRLAVLGLLTDCDHFGRYTMPSEDWITRVAKGLTSFVRVGERMPTGKRLTKALVKRCGLSEELAERLRKQLEGGKSE